MKKIILIGCALMSASVAYAQHDSIGKGGDERELILKNLIGEIDAYLLSSEGKTQFPEVEHYNQAHPNMTLHQIAQDLNPTLADPGVVVRDGAGKVRDCVSYTAPIRYFICRNDFLPSKIELSDQPGIYAFLFHELLVQAGLENPLSKEVSSEYTISGRMTFSKKTYEKWVPSSENENIYLKAERITQQFLGKGVKIEFGSASSNNISKRLNLLEKVLIRLKNDFPQKRLQMNFDARVDFSDDPYYSVVSLKSHICLGEISADELYQRFLPALVNQVLFDQEKEAWSNSRADSFAQVRQFILENDMVCKAVVRAQGYLFTYNQDHMFRNSEATPNSYRNPNTNQLAILIHSDQIVNYESFMDGKYLATRMVARNPRESGESRFGFSSEGHLMVYTAQNDGALEVLVRCVKKEIKK